MRALSIIDAEASNDDIGNGIFQRHDYFIDYLLAAVAVGHWPHVPRGLFTILS